MTIARLNPDEFNSKLETNDYILIDIRTPEEKVFYWYIENTDYFFDIYREEFVSQINLLDKNKKYLIYCFHWNRTQSALWYMEKQWFIEVYDLIWWIVNWENFWYKLIKD